MQKTKCEDCKSEFQSVAWHPGAECPACKSKNFFPKVEVGEAESGSRQEASASSQHAVETKGWRHSSLVGVAAVLAIIVTAALVFRNPTSKRPERAYVCDECGHTFNEEISPPPIECPDCGALKGAMAILWKCGKCGEVSEERRFMLTGEALQAQRSGNAPVRPASVTGKSQPYLVKLLGEDWQKASGPETVEREQTWRCSHCGNTGMDGAREVHTWPEQ